MSHEVIQVIKLVKYNRKSYEMMRVTCKRILTTVNKEIYKNKHSHEMTQFRNRIAVRSLLHESVLIYRSSHESIFESPVYRVHNEHESGSGLGLLQRVRISPNESETLQHASEHTNKYKYTLNTLPSTPTHTCTPTHVHIQVYTYTYMTHLKH